MFSIRQATQRDFNKIFTLYKKVADKSNGLARSGDEITDAYIENFMDHAGKTGIELVIDDPDNEEKIMAEIHCYKLPPKVFGHTLSELTIAVDPDHQRKGIGRMIFSHMLELISNERPDILRVELITRESNRNAIGLYEKIGFKQEGRLEKRIRNDQNNFEADIPMAWINNNYSG